MSVEFGVFYQVYTNKKPVRFVLDNFRQHFPDNPITLISDGGVDFSDIAEEYNCSFHLRENIFGNEENGYDRHCYDAYRTIEWWKRQKLTCEECGCDYTMIMEDDVYVKSHFNQQWSKRLLNWGMKHQDMVCVVVLSTMQKHFYQSMMMSLKISQRTWIN